MTRFDPAGPLRGALRPPADKSISHRAALIAAMGEGETDDRGLPRRRRHPLDPGRGRRRSGREVEGAERRRGSRRELRIARRRPARRRARRRSTSATPAPCCACCRAGWRGRTAGEWTLDGDDSIRRRPVDRIADAAARDGRRPRAPARSACRRCEIEGAPLHGIDLRDAGRQRPGQVLPALRRPARRGRDARRRAAAEPRPHRADARRRRRRRSSATGGAVVDRARPSALEPGAIVVPADISSAAFFIVAALLVPGSEVRARRGRRQPDPHRPAGDPRADGRRRSRSSRRASDGGEPIGDLARPRHRAARHRGRRRRDPAGDRRAAAGRPRRLLRRGRRRRSATPPSCAARSPTGSRP